MELRNSLWRALARGRYMLTAPSLVLIDEAIETIRGEEFGPILVQVQDKPPCHYRLVMSALSKVMGKI